MVQKKTDKEYFMNKKIINQLLVKGKSSISEKIWVKTLKLFFKAFVKNHKKVINRAFINIAPLVKVKQLKKKKRQLQLKEFPYIVNNRKRISSALKFFLNKTSNKSEIKTYQKLSASLLAVTNKSGIITNKKKSLYEYAFIKKKYFYYR